MILKRSVEHKGIKGHPAAGASLPDYLCSRWCERALMGHESTADDVRFAGCTGRVVFFAGKKDIRYAASLYPALPLALALALDGVLQRRRWVAYGLMVLPLVNNFELALRQNRVPLSIETTAIETTAYEGELEKLYGSADSSAYFLYKDGGERESPFSNRHFREVVEHVPGLPWPMKFHCCLRWRGCQTAEWRGYFAFQRRRFQTRCLPRCMRISGDCSN